MVALTQTQTAGAPRAPQAPPQPAVGSGSIAGIVSAADTGRPLRRVRVTLTNSETNASFGTAVTDLEGRFRFEKLPAAPLTLKAARNGYLDVTFGQKKPGSGRAGTSIQLADGQKIDNIQMQMPRGGVISGSVVDEVGDPVQGVPMRVWRYTIRNGARELTATANSGTTDDRGQYRVSGLVPGDYIVCAVPRDELVTLAAQYDSLMARVAEIEASRAQQTARGGPPPPPSPPASLIGPRPGDPQESYIMVCGPNTTRMADATTISLDVGEERPGNHIQLQLLPIARVSGRVVWNDGKLPIAGGSGGSTADTQVHLVDAAAPNSPAGPRVIHVKADGSFAFTSVYPGVYRLEAHADVPMQGAPNIMTPLWASQEISVSGQPVSDVTLSMSHGMNVSGRVVIEGGSGVDLSRLRITAVPAGPQYGEFEIPPATVAPDGRFTITGVVPGTYRIGSRGSGGGVIKSSVFAGVDTLDVPIEVKAGEHVSGGVLTAIPRFAEITGLLQDGAGKPVPGFTVIVFPLDQRYWTPGSRRVQAARPGTDGRFTLRNLVAGEYRLAAVTDIETGEWFDPAVLRTLLPAAVAITLADGDRKDQALRIGR
ncbi:MAG TPA: carboxypeptidase-like regulatory domain-containing protein [Vicinamibacterales bacterium]|nr:carboxypeptidase-like regulatory domain-containing protein [Vicinamibacterales bacterium]